MTLNTVKCSRKLNLDLSPKFPESGILGLRRDFSNSFPMALLYKTSDRGDIRDLIDIARLIQ